MTRVLQTRQVGLTTHASGHVMAPPDIVYQVEEAPQPRRPHIPIGAKLWGVFIIVGGVYWLVQGAINTFS